MSSNSTPTFFPNLADFGLEILGGALSPIVSVVVPADSTIALSPSQSYVIDAGTASASPPQLDYSVDYIDVFVETTSRTYATGANIIQRTAATEIKSDYVEMDIDNILPVGTGVINLGGHYKGWVELADGWNYLGKEQSGGTFVCRDAITATCVLPSGTLNGTIYTFIPGSGNITVVPSGGSIWNSTGGYNNPLSSGITSSSPIQYVSNGLNTWFGLDAVSNWSPLNQTDVVALWDAGAASFPLHGIKGGYDLNGTTQYFSSLNNVPLAGVSGIPQYPITIVTWVKPDVTSGARIITSLDAGTANTSLRLYQSTTSVAARSNLTAGSWGEATAASVFTAGRWTCIIGVWTSESSRSVYADTNTTGGGNSTTVATTGIVNIHIGKDADGGNNYDGVIAYTAILPTDLSGAENAGKRQRIFNGGDPEVEAGVTATALYHFDNDNGADAKGLYDLTPVNAPSGQNNLIVLRDKKKNTYHVRATTSAPTWDSTLYNSRGGAAFDASLSQFMTCEATPVAAAPFQVYAIASANSNAEANGLFWLGDKDVNADYWHLRLAGTTTGDPIQLRVADGSVSVASTSSGYTAGTTHLVWAIESSNISRAIRVDGTNEGTDTTDLSPDGADRIGLGGTLDLTPDVFHNGSIGICWLKNSTQVGDRNLVHNWINREFGTNI